MRLRTVVLVGTTRVVRARSNGRDEARCRARRSGGRDLAQAMGGTLTQHRSADQSGRRDAEEHTHPVTCARRLGHRDGAGADTVVQDEVEGTGLT